MNKSQAYVETNLKLFRIIMFHDVIDFICPEHCQPYDKTTLTKLINNNIGTQHIS